MKLYLVRHAEALGIGENIRRPLSEKGFEEVETIAKFLANNQFKVAQIFHSEKLRAEQTAEKIAQYLSSNPKVEVMSGLLPDDDIEPMVAYCNHEQEDTMLVGHLPYLANLALELMSVNEATTCINFHTAAVLCLERIADSYWCIQWFISPSLVQK